ncbi:MAG: hypothetical protein AB8D78_03545 [Akkermansiaceae bacterium]
MKKILMINFVLLNLSLLGIAGEAQYQGDGKFEDRGEEAVLSRYAVDLGKVSLGQSKNYKFTLAGLPEEQFVAGIVLDLNRPVARMTKPDWFKDVRVKMILTDVKAGTEVFAIDQTLSRYTWSNVSPSAKDGASFVYGRDGKQSFFTPSKAVEYELKLEIESTCEDAVSAAMFLTATGNKEEAIQNSFPIKLPF